LDKRTPLLERAKFLAIFTSNLDEFFMKRVAVLRQERTAIGLVRLRELRDKLCPQLHRQAECYREVIVPALATHGIVLRSWEELTVGQREEARRYFESNISPALTPLVIDPDHPFPFLANLSTSLIFRLGEPGQTEVMHGRVKVPGDLPPWIALTADTSPGQRLFVQLCDIVRANLDRLYHGRTITATTAVRLTRDAEVDLEDDPALGLREQVEEHVRLRRYEPVVRLEFGPGADPAIREMLRERFELSPTDIYEMPGEATTPRSFRSPRCRLLSSATRRGSPPPSGAPERAHGDLRGHPGGGHPPPSSLRLLRHHRRALHQRCRQRSPDGVHQDDGLPNRRRHALRPFSHPSRRARQAGRLRHGDSGSLRRGTQPALGGGARTSGAHVTYGISGLKTHAKT